MSEGFTYAKFKKAYDLLKDFPPQSLTVFMTDPEMRDRGYSEEQISRMISGGELEMPEDKEKFDAWFLEWVKSRTTKH